MYQDPGMGKIFSQAPYLSDVQYTIKTEASQNEGIAYIISQKEPEMRSNQDPVLKPAIIPVGIAISTDINKLSSERKNVHWKALAIFFETGRPSFIEVPRFPERKLEAQR